MHDRSRPALAVAARAASDESLDAERWTNEGGSFVAAATARVAAATARVR